MEKYIKRDKALNIYCCIILIVTVAFVLASIGEDYMIFALIAAGKAFTFSIVFCALIKLDANMKLNILKNVREDKQMKHIKFFNKTNILFSIALLISLFILIFIDTTNTLRTFFICLLITSIALLLVNIYFTAAKVLKAHNNILSDGKEEK